MKQVLNSLLLVMILAALLFSIFIIVNLEDKEPKPFETVLTTGEKTVNTRIPTKDHQCLEFEIVYKGEIPRTLVEGYVHGIVRPIAFQKNMLEILKYNSLEHLRDSLKYYIIPMDSTFKISLLDTKYHLSPEVQELWDEYMTRKIEETKAEERAKNLEILYGE
jgi:hypothetical protein